MDNRSDGQHRDDGTPLSNNGQRQRRLPDTDVGQRRGAETHIRPGNTSADVSTAVDIHGRPVHHGRPGATIPNKE